MKKIKQIRRVKGILFNPTVAILVAIIIYTGLPAQIAMANYEIDGLIDVHATMGDSIRRYSGMLTVTSYQDSAATSAEPGQAASSSYYADLASGSMGVSFSANNAYGSWDGYSPAWWDASSESSVEMSDRLDFNVPAGYYPEDINVTIKGFVAGYQYASGKYFSSVEWYGTIGGGNSFHFNAWGQLNMATSYYYPFAITRVLIHGGTTLSSPTVIECQINFQFGPSALGAGLHDTYPPPEYSSAGADLSMQITSMDVPDGITWTSDSGVFKTIPKCLKADLNCDGIVDFIDYAIFAAAWLSEPGQDNWNPACDISNPADNIINIFDLDVFCDYWLVSY